MKKKINKKQSSIFPSNLYLKNYKLYNNLTNINLKKINLFYGHNSSGKSSILESISLMKQSIVNPAEGTLATKGDLQIPTFREIITDGDLKKSLSIGFRSELSSHIIVKSFKWENEKVVLNEVKIYDINNQDDLLPSDKNLVITIIFKKPEKNQYSTTPFFFGRLIRNMIIGKSGVAQGTGENYIGKSRFY